MHQKSVVRETVIAKLKSWCIPSGIFTDWMGKIDGIAPYIVALRTRK